MPRWHGQEMVMLIHEQNLRERENSGSGSGSSVPTSLSSISGCVGVEPLQLRWRHIQALVRLTQVVHVLADVITDWETIMDSFEQLISILLSSSAIAANSSASGKDGRPNVMHSNCHAVVHEELTPLEIDRISQSIERFKGFTVFLSDSALVRLMTSLVALSLNALAVSATSSVQNSATGNSSSTSSSASSTHAPGAIFSNENSMITHHAGGLLQCLSGSQSTITPTVTSPTYMVNALADGSLSFSLHLAVEIAKINAFRMACVWQMVTSHLRMMTTHKVSSYLQQTHIWYYFRSKISSIDASNEKNSGVGNP